MTFKAQSEPLMTSPSDTQMSGENDRSMPSPPPDSPASAKCCITGERPAKGPPKATTGAPVTSDNRAAKGE